MVSIALPAVLSDYLEGINHNQLNQVVACFREDATVHDENTDINGIDAIRAWIQDTQEKYQPTLTLKSIADIDGQFTLKCEVSGTFPGSPIVLDYRFTLHDDRIVGLYID